MDRARAAGALAAVVLLACARAAMAAGPPPGQRSELPPASAPPGVRRPLPDYRGRPPLPPSPASRLIWIPRIVLYPAHRLLDSFVSWPVHRVLVWGEEYRVYPFLRRICVWRDGRLRIFPTFLYEFGLTPSVGLFFDYDDLLWPRHQLEVHGGFGGDHWLSLELRDRFWLPRGSRNRFSLHGRALRRPDLPFYGIGPRTFQSQGTYYRQDLVEARAEWARQLGSLSWLKLFAGYRRTSFAHGREPSIEQLFPVERLPGIGGYSLLGAGGRLQLDTRRPQLDASGTGLRLELFGSARLDPGRPQQSFARWGGEADGFWDVSGVGHVLGLHGFVAFAERLGHEPVPFSELITLGGRHRMRGYLPGRFRGDSALELTVNYRYPIWTYLDAELFVSVGNAFNGHLEGLAPQRLFLCWGVAFRASIARDISFDLLIGAGTNRLDSPRLGLNSANVAIGFHPGF